MPYPHRHYCLEYRTQVTFQFTKRELTLNDNETGFIKDLVARKTVPLGEVTFIWPKGADQVAADFESRTKEARYRRRHDTAVDLRTAGDALFAQLRWDSSTAGAAIARTIQMCKDEGLAVRNEGMPSVYSEEPSGLKRKRPSWDAAAETDAKRLTLTAEVWAVELSPYCKYVSSSHKSQQPKIFSTHRSMQEANQQARTWWTTEAWGVDSLHETCRPGEPYTGNACVEGGGGIMTVSVVQVPVADLGVAMVKKALKMRGAQTTDAGPHMLRRRLSELVSAKQ